jgi:hypothetical protein
VNRVAHSGAPQVGDVLLSFIAFSMTVVSLIAFSMIVASFIAGP